MEPIKWWPSGDGICSQLVTLVANDFRNNKRLPEINGSTSGDALALARIRVPLELDSIRTAAGGACCFAELLGAELVVIPSTNWLKWGNWMIGPLLQRFDKQLPLNSKERQWIIIIIVRKWVQTMASQLCNAMKTTKPITTYQYNV